MKAKLAGALLALTLLTPSPAALPAPSEPRQLFDEALSAFHTSLTNSTDGAIRNRAQETARRGTELLDQLDADIATYEQAEGAAQDNWMAAISQAADVSELLGRMHMEELPYAFSYVPVQNRAKQRYAAAAQYLERILARKDSLQGQSIDEVALRRRLFLDYFLIKDETSCTAQLKALAQLQQKKPEAAPTPLFTPIEMRLGDEEISGSIEIEFDILEDGRVANPRIVDSTYTEYGGDEFEFLLLFWFREFRFTPGVDGDNLVPVESARYRLEGTRRLTRVRRRIQ